MNTEQMNALRGLELAERHANDDPSTDDVSWLEHYRGATENENAPTFETANDVSRYVNAYHVCFTSSGYVADWNRERLRDWLCELQMTDKQINTFCDDHGIRDTTSKWGKPN